MKKIEHLGIAIKDASVSIPLFNALFNCEPYKIEEVESEKVRTIFYQVGPNKMELLEATSPDSTIATFIEKRGEGIHHIAYDVEDIYAEMERLKQAGFTFIHEQPKNGADNKLIAFLHPKSTNGVLIELCQERI
ncbi:MAG: methylmalonyl-CoA epimerase [Bacteroidia bacterium]|jgi:methylmalonyl-CoA/ethylmalonyl-CoA epimerase|nr:methylmalonyl-CoA epimerase [Bacteroidia bacterium]